MPLSKLFHKRNSLKDKKALKSSDPGSCANEDASTSAKCDNDVKETVHQDLLSSQQLSPTTDTVVGTPCESEKKEVQQPSKTNGNASKGEEVLHAIPVEQLQTKSESILKVSPECKSEGNQTENPTLRDHLASNNEVVMEGSLGLKNEQANNVDSSTGQLLLTAKTVSCDFVSGNITSVNYTPTEQLSPMTKNITLGYGDSENDNGASTSSEPPYQSADSIKNMSCDFKDGATTVGSSANEKLPLKTENIPGLLSECMHELTQGEIIQLSENVQENNDEPVLNLKETGCAKGKSIQPHHNGSSSTSCELGQPSENVDKEGNIKKSPLNTTRSSSFKEAGLKPVHSKTRRRKCESESAASNSTDDEGFEDKVLQFRGKDLEEVIGKCVNRLIRESISMAVRNVNVEGIYEEVIKTISDRSQSESSNTSECPGIVEQKLHTNSVEEYADLEMLETFEDSLELQDKSSEISAENLEGKIIMEVSQEAEEPRTEMANENDCANQKLHVVDGNVSGNVTAVSEDKDIDLDGYRADLEESTSLHSLTTTETNESNVCIDNIENETEHEKHTMTTTSDECNSKTEESSPHPMNNEKIIEETMNVKSTSTDDSNTCGVNLNEDLERVLEKAEIVENSLNQDSGETPKQNVGMLRVESEDLISMSDESVAEMLNASEQTPVGEEELPIDLGMNLPQQNQTIEDGKKLNWKVGYLHVKLPPKSRGKGHLKAWKKRCVAIQPDEFSNDPQDPCLMISVYSGESGHARKHSASFWKSVSCRRAVVYRSSSSSRRHAFTVADDGKPLVHLAADSEALSQEWMAAMRSVLWPPSPVVQLEKMLNGSQFEVSLIDNEFSYRAGLLGAYGHLTITPKKLILVHPQQGYVLQEWYLNTVDRFELMQQTRIEDVHKVLCMTTCSDSSTGKGEILIFCREAVALLQSLALTIHQILTHHSKQEGGKYQKELEEMAEWLVPSTNSEVAEDYYKVPPRQVRSLLDIPNFIFDKPLTPVASVACPSGIAMSAQKMPLLEEVPKTNPSRASQDSGISAGAAADDFLNCSSTSFVVGGGNFPPKSSDSELSDSYTPPVSPKVKHGEEKKKQVKA